MGTNTPPPCPDNSQLWAWVKDCWRPIKSYRIVKRGKKRGWVEVELYDPPGRRRVVPTTSIRPKDRVTSTVGKIKSVKTVKRKRLVQKNGSTS